MLVIVLIVVAAAIGAGLVVANRGDEEKTATANEGATPVLDGGISAADLSSFAGHWGLVEGINDPAGIDVLYTEPGRYSITPQPSSASSPMSIDASSAWSRSSTAADQIALHSVRKRESGGGRTDRRRGDREGARQADKTSI